MTVVLLVLAIPDLQPLPEFDPYWWSYGVVKFGGASTWVGAG
jgi:hypothetical protein